MPSGDLSRILEDRLHPAIVDLWFALQPLRRVTGFLQSGAHPDDETSAMLAALRLRDGLSVGYVCATRGEGGQNDIGQETGLALAALRTAEMERAAERLDIRLWWLSEGPDDTISDFGFSKSGKETLGRWGRDRTLSRFVDVIRAERPDILCPTFLDVPGQHGHHRAMTAAAHEAIGLAADPAYRGSELPSWQVSKLYLPAWGGGGTAYDDEEPPPAATVTVPVAGRDPVTGWPWERIGQQSRAFHRTQGMGAWVAAGTERDRPLHLAWSAVGPDGGAVTDNLPETLGDLGLAAAQSAIEAAIDAFPDRAAVAAAAGRALACLAEADTGPTHAHRLARKAAELARVLRLAAGIEVGARADRDRVVPGARVRIAVDLHPGTADRAEVQLALPPGWRETAPGEVEVGPDAAPSDPFPTSSDPLAPPLPALRLGFAIGGAEAECLLPLDPAPQVIPATSATVAPAAAILNLALPVAAPVLRVLDSEPTGASPALELPPGWGQRPDGRAILIMPPAAPTPGLHDFPLLLDGRPAMTIARVGGAHTPLRAVCRPAVFRLRAAAIALPAVQVGYVGAGNDNVLRRLQEVGLAARGLADEDLSGDLPGDLDTIVVGVFAFRFRAGLAAAAPRLHAFVRGGGTLVTLYHRPWDGWEPDAIPPLRIEIGQPSLRFRVTDAAAPVRHLAPDHPVLSSPNRIGPDDWAGWDKERGLYFARSWDPAYVPLVEMADPGEAPHHGALLSAEVGRGRHVHVALNLHHQMERLTPGAFRLMANCLARR